MACDVGTVYMWFWQESLKHWQKFVAKLLATVCLQTSLLEYDVDSI
jgi:hypothetical protein